MLYCKRTVGLATLMFLLFMPSATVSQSRPVVDSLLRLVAKEKKGILQYKAYISLGGQYVFTSADSAVFFNKKALEVAKALGSDSLIASGYYSIASVEATRNNYQTALDYCDSAFYFFEKAGNEPALAMVRNVQGGVNMARGDNEAAANMYFDAIEYTEKDTGSNRILFTYHNVVILMNNMEKHQEALEYAFKQYRWAKRLHISEEIAYACSNITDSYMELKDSAKAVRYMQEFLSLLPQTEDPYLHIIGKNQLGMLSYLSKDYKQAAAHFIQSLEQNNDLVDQQLACITLLNLGRVYQKMEDYPKSDSCFLKAVEISYGHNIKEERKSAWEMLTANAEVNKDYEKAYYYAIQLHKLKDSLLNEKTATALANAATKYKLTEKQNELHLQEARISRLRAGQLAILISLAGLLLLGTLLFNRYKLKKKLEQQDMLLKERSRIGRELHDDLGGSLSTIRILSEVNNVEDEVFTAKNYRKISLHSKELLQKMNEIVWALNNTNNSLDNLVVYTRSQSAKMLDEVNLLYSFDIADPIPAIEVQGILRRHLYLTVKEALHNVIKHAGATMVTFKIFFESEALFITIHDNGKGIAEEALREHKGNGLGNMQKHINALHGKISVKKSNGTLVEITVSLRDLSHEGSVPL